MSKINITGNRGQVNIANGNSTINTSIKGKSGENKKNQVNIANDNSTINSSIDEDDNIVADLINDVLKDI
jgi:hypothetical protein